MMYPPVLLKTSMAVIGNLLLSFNLFSFPYKIMESQFISMYAFVLENFWAELGLRALFRIPSICKRCNIRAFHYVLCDYNIYNKKPKGLTLMELFTATGEVKKFFTTRVFDVYTTGDTAHIDTIFKFLPNTRQHGCVDILHCCNDPCL
jgi:hypothetical protein